VSRARSLDDIAAQGLCSGCGLCAGATDSANVRMVMTRDGYLRPRVSSLIDAQEHARLVSLCPGAHIALERSEPPPHSDSIWGAYHGIHKGHACDEEMRFRASSGGVISAIAEFLLRSRRVEFVLQIAADHAAPLRSRVRLSRTRDEVLAAAGARYGPASPLEAIGEALAREAPFAVIGKPCDLAGLRNLARLDPRVDRWVRLTIGFFCGGVSSVRISEAIVGKYGLQPREVKTLRYRGHGCPGATFVEAVDGRVFTQTYDETWSDELNEEIQFRCKICPDSIGEQADIVCGDAWATMDGYAHIEHEGWDSIIARTARGAALLGEMRTARALTLEPLVIRDLDRIQPHQVERKTEVLARLTGLALQGRLRPKFRGLRLVRNAWTGRRRFVRTALGTMRRLRRGANLEDTRAETAPVEPGAESAMPTRESASWSGYGLLGPALGVMAVGVGIPLVMLLVYSLWTQTYVTFDHTPTLANYLRFFERPLYVMLLARSLGVSLATTLATLVLAYPMAYLIAFHGGRHRATWLALVVVPFWTSYLLRIFAWKVILGYTGVINSALLELKIIDQPIAALLYNPLAVVVALTQAWLPFVMLPIYVSLVRIDPSLREAAADLGDGGLHRFLRVILPLSVPGVIAAALLVFIPTVGEYVTPALLGGFSGTLIGNLIQGQFGRANNWPMGAALSVITMLAATLCALTIQAAFGRFRRVSA
jgi:ABC-type spermidine/putrescine transport system permease subunit I/coenzyme F420-reducing hydrogenase beta subunit